MSTQTGVSGITFGDGTTQNTASVLGATGIPVINVYTAPGTWTRPASIKAIKVTVVGGGGAGGNINTTPNVNQAGGAGGGGGTTISSYAFPAIPGPQPFTVGAAAGTSSFGVAPFVVLTATGGTSGIPAFSGPTPSGYPLGGAGGVGSGGQINLTGSQGGTAATQMSGSGGSSFYGQGAAGQFVIGVTQFVGLNGNNYGGGGSGAVRQGAGTPGNGGTGAPGVIIVEEFY
jgi:hypothetical protein